MEDFVAYLETIRQKYHLPSLAVAVARPNHPDEITVCGIRKSGSPERVGFDDQYHMGSCSKAVTAAVIHQLIGEGKLKITDTLEDIVPGKMPDDKKDITVAQLLTHTAGLQANLALADGEQPKRGEHHYSNIGYIMLGEIAENVTGKPFRQLAQEMIFDELGMKSAGFGPPAGDGVDQPWGHTHNEQHALSPSNTDNPEIYAAAGTMHASVGDWLEFLKFEMQQRRINEPFASADGYTDSALMLDGQGALSHDGSNNVNYARQVIMPKQQAAFVIATNDGSEFAEAAVNEVSAYLTEQLLQQARPATLMRQNPRHR